jgi:hypothetical protein
VARQHELRRIALMVRVIVAFSSLAQEHSVGLKCMPESSAVSHPVPVALSGNGAAAAPEAGQPGASAALTCRCSRLRPAPSSKRRSSTRASPREGGCSGGSCSRAHASSEAPTDQYTHRLPLHPHA